MYSNIYNQNFKLFVRKEANQIKLLVIVLLNILFCCKKTLLEELFSVTLLVYCCEFMYRSFLRCSETLEESCSRQLQLIASSRKECYCKQNMFCNYCKFQEILRRDIFHPGMKYLYENVISLMSRSRLEQAGSRLAGTG